MSRPKSETAWLRRMKRIKLYGEEDIEDDVVALLRQLNVNVESARESGHRGKSAAFQAAWAIKRRRFLLTRNAKDFLERRADTVSPGQWHHHDLRRLERYPPVGRHVHRLTEIVPYEQIYRGAKITLSPEEMVM